MSHQYATGSGGMYNAQALQDADGDRAWLMGVVHEWTGRPVMCERGNVTFYVRLLDGTVPPAFATTFETEMVEARARGNIEFDLQRGAWPRREQPTLEQAIEQAERAFA